MTTIGATPVAYPMRLRCCGASLIATNKKAALSMIKALLETAENAGADVIATACLSVSSTSRSTRPRSTTSSVRISRCRSCTSPAHGSVLRIPAKKLGIGTEVVASPEVLRCARGEST